ncbi:MAG TPA: hypothetical protein VN822_12300 [Candidatus Acidoferrales bacterium]|nr:hypothetical protein [Candidatus Acidoferrales bacterium]
MKRALFLGILILGCSASAHAQYGGIGGGSLSGPSFPAIVNYPPTHFAVTHVAGTDTDFIPSNFRSFDQAVAEGRAALAAQARTITQAADENSKAQKAKARLAIVQDNSGKLVFTSNR